MTDAKPARRAAVSAFRDHLRLPMILRGRATTPIAQPGTDAIEPSAPSGRMKLPSRTSRTRPSLYGLTFVGCVLVPAFLSAIYLIFLASDQYLAEARFAVRKAQTQSMLIDKASNSGAGAVSNAITGAGLADQDAYIIASYLRSRAAIEDIQPRLNLVEIFQRPEADFWSRLKRNPSMEELVDYWNTKIVTYVDGPSGVVTVTARAFRPDDARRLVDAFVEASERLANRLSERARRDAMRKSEEEVRRTESMVRQALTDLRAYRDREGLITPLMEATTTSKLLAETLSDRIKLQNDYFVAVRALSPQAPSVQALRARLDALDAEIDKLKSQLTSRSGEGNSVSAAIVRFEELEMRRVFAEKMYSLAQEALERSRLKAEQQAIYISVFVPPHLPQEARYPERYSMSLILSIGFLLLWGVAALTAAAIEDHAL